MHTTILTCRQLEDIISSDFSRYSEANASEYLEDLEKLL